MGFITCFRIRLGPRSNFVTYTALEQMLSADAYISWAHLCRCQKATVDGTAGPCRHDAPLSLPPRIGKCDFSGRRSNRLTRCREDQSHAGLGVSHQDLRWPGVKFGHDRGAFSAECRQLVLFGSAAEQAVRTLFDAAMSR